MPNAVPEHPSTRDFRVSIPAGRTLAAGAALLVVLSVGVVGGAVIAWHGPLGAIPSHLLPTHTPSIRVSTERSLHPAATYPSGVDVSHGQGTINWNSTASAGIQFAIAKATQGTTFTDPDFVSNMVNGRAAGIYMGAYDFACPVTDSSVYCTATNATTEANFFLNEAGPYFKSGYLYPALDLEEGCGSITPQQMTDWVVQWMSTVQSYALKYDNKSITPFIYMDQSYASTSCMTSTVTQYPLWIADPGASSPGTGFFPTWTLWQYSWTGSVSGITGNVDEDYFNGNISQLVSGYTFGGNGTGGTPLASSYTINDLTNGSAIYCTNTVKAGDQLEFIASATGGTKPYKYSWNFGDGTTGTGSPANHSYSKTGTVDPILTVTDAKGTTNSSGQGCTLTIASGMILTSPLSANPNPVGTGNSTTLSVSVTGGTSPYTYAYVGLPSGCASQNLPSFPCVPTKAGSFPITVYVNDSAKHTIASSTLLTVQSSSLPTLSGVVIQAASSTLSIGTNETLLAVPSCTGGTCPSSGITYVWSVSNSLANLSTTGQQSTILTAGSQAGTVVVQVVASLNGGSQTSSTSITITNSSIPILSTVTISPANPQVQPNSTTMFSAAPGCTGGTCPSGVSYAWTVNNTLGSLTSPSGASTTFVAAGSAGSVLLQVTASLGGHSAAGTSTITIVSGGQGTLTSVSISPVSPTLTPGSQTALTATPTCLGGSCPTGITYSWSVNNSLASISPTSGASVKLVAGSSPGLATVTVKASLGSGTMIGTDPVTISSSAGGYLTSVSISPTSGSISAGASSVYTASIACSGNCPSGVTYLWTYTNQSLGKLNATTGASVTFASSGAPGSFTLTVTASAGTTSVQGSVNVTVRSSSGTSTSTPFSLSSTDVDLLLIGLIALVGVVGIAVVLRSRRMKAPPPEPDPSVYP